MCQLLELTDMAQPLTRFSKIWQYRIKVLINAKKISVLCKNKLAKLVRGSSERNLIAHPIETTQPISAGDLVRVRPKREILKSLDDHNKYRGCVFTKDMFRYCDGIYKVFKVVDYFYDEARSQIRKCKDTVILEGVLCNGDTSKAFKQKCDRSCFFFWKTTWLEKIS